jgi:hypothetical protein
MGYGVLWLSGNKLSLLFVTALGEMIGVMILWWRLKTDLFQLRF